MKVNIDEFRKSEIDILIKMANYLGYVDASEDDIVEEVTTSGNVEKHSMKLVVDGNNCGEFYYFNILPNPDLKLIKSFRGEYDFLSNFYDVPVTYEDITYDNAEAAFQAQKCVNDEDKQQFVGIDGKSAKHLGRKVQLRQDWNDVKYNIMKNIVFNKFAQNNDIALKLFATDKAELVEGNTWNDTTWGVSLKTGKGKNWLGNILMEVREELK